MHRLLTERTAWELSILTSVGVAGISSSPPLSFLLASLLLPSSKVSIAWVPFVLTACLYHRFRYFLLSVLSLFNCQLITDISLFPPHAYHYIHTPLLTIVIHPLALLVFESEIGTLVRSLTLSTYYNSCGKGGLVVGPRRSSWCSLLGWTRCGEDGVGHLVCTWFH